MRFRNVILSVVLLSRYYYDRNSNNETKERKRLMSSSLLFCPTDRLAALRVCLSSPHTQKGPWWWVIRGSLSLYYTSTVMRRRRRIFFFVSFLSVVVVRVYYIFAGPLFTREWDYILTFLFFCFPSSPRLSLSLSLSWCVAPVLFLFFQGHHQHSSDVHENKSVRVRWRPSTGPDTSCANQITTRFFSVWIWRVWPGTHFLFYLSTDFLYLLFIFYSAMNLSELRISTTFYTIVELTEKKQQTRVRT